MKRYLFLSLLTLLAACTDDGGTIENLTACELYCDNVMSNCNGDNALYASRDECETTCAAMPEGNPDDQSGNSVYCRAYHAGAPAADDPATHCPHASAASDMNVCGSYCEGYCTQVLSNCSGDNAVFADMDTCLTACAAMPVGSFDDKQGDSVQCRTYHGSFPAAAEPATHCPHAAMTSHMGVCGSVCEAYCDQAMSNCSGDNALYASRDECMTACDGFDQSGNWSDITGDTAQCRTYHASFPAAAAPDVHCGHAGEEPTDLCVP
jgi:hypothetical protein